MTLLDRYYLRRMTAVFLRTALALLGLFIVIDLLAERRGQIMDHDIPWQVVVQYYAALAPNLLYQMAPLAVLISALLVLGESAQHNEVTAALAGGISLRRFVRIPVAVALAVALLMFAMDESVGAASYRKAAHLKEQFFRLRSDANRPGVSWANLEGGWTCHVLKFNRIALTGEQVYMYALRDDVNERIDARRIYWDEEESQWILEDGARYTHAPDWGPPARQQRITQGPAPFSEPPERLFALDAPPESKSRGDLADDIEQAEANGLNAASHWVTYYAKFSYPALNFVMIWLAIPFALRMRRGGLAISFGLSIAIALSYLVIYGVGLGLGHTGYLPPVTAAWFANGLFLAGGLFLFARTPT
jgi:lipopolysaccharide export system permease protein